MSNLFDLTVALSAYRVITILVGLAIIYFGYRLFTKGVFEKAGELKAVWGDKHLTLKQAAPGTFFALFGAIIVVVSLWRGIGIDDYRKTTLDTNLQKMTDMLKSEPIEDLRPILEKIARNEQINEQERSIVIKTLEEHKTSLWAMPVDLMEELKRQEGVM